MNLLPGLHEALRLMALNDLDFAPGTIMKRIEQLEGEMRGTKTVIERMDEADRINETDRQLIELEKLKSTVAQRDEQLRLLHVQCDVGDKAFQHQHERCKELESQLRMAMSELGKIKSDFRALEEQLRVALERVKELEHSLMEYGTPALIKKIDTAQKERDEAIAACAAMKECLKEVWDSCEMGWISEPETEDAYSECGECGSKRFMPVGEIKHKPDCLQGKVHKALSTTTTKQ